MYLSSMPEEQPTMTIESNNKCSKNTCIFRACAAQGNKNSVYAYIVIAGHVAIPSQNERRRNFVSSLSILDTRRLMLVQTPGDLYVDYYRRTMTCIQVCVCVVYV